MEILIIVGIFVILLSLGKLPKIIQDITDTVKNIKRAK
jgi:Sec-independent protein translocase protein TatA